MHSNMYKITDRPDPPDSLLSELDAITAIIGNTKNLLSLAEEREKQLIAALDCLTAPPIRLPIVTTESEASAGPSTCPISSPPAADKLRRGYDYRGKTKRCFEVNEIWIGVMSLLLHDFPKKQAAIQQALKARGRTRTFLARTQAELFPDKNHEWGKKYSVQILGGWYLDKNMSGDRMKSLLRSAVEAVGLTWGRDVVVRLYS